MSGVPIPLQLFASHRIEAMANVVVDQNFVRGTHCLFDGMQLLGDFKTRTLSSSPVMIRK